MKADKIEVTRKGKQLWMGDSLIAECASDGVAAVIELSLIRGKVTKAEADIFLTVFR